MRQITLALLVCPLAPLFCGGGVLGAGPTPTPTQAAHAASTGAGADVHAQLIPLPAIVLSNFPFLIPFSLLFQTRAQKSPLPPVTKTLTTLTVCDATGSEFLPSNCTPTPLAQHTLSESTDAAPPSGDSDSTSQQIQRDVDVHRMPTSTSPPPLIRQPSSTPHGRLVKRQLVSISVSTPVAPFREAPSPYAPRDSPYDSRHSEDYRHGFASDIEPLSESHGAGPLSGNSRAEDSDIATGGIDGEGADIFSRILGFPRISKSSNSGASALPASSSIAPNSASLPSSGGAGVLSFTELSSPISASREGSSTAAAVLSSHPVATPVSITTLMSAESSTSLLLAPESIANGAAVHGILGSTAEHQQCQTGMLRCAPDGQRFDTCLFGRWGTIRTCAQGTRCVPVGDNTIACV